ncbi:uncharacterized protein LOC130990702 [Salvia miltiorrhiza]|uniref:uncharacterized protein LOC130990702 n=1 Tax=Salvia miltiorrhiza TaxID=226208 RepID=UPI0025AC3762|nr:uncharacterized protein LOC130990702 [Salvia miltiorrhiza]
MAHKYCFEAHDRSLRDIMRSSDRFGKSFGGLVVVLGGDFRQILPMIPKGSRHDISNTSGSDVEETKEFAEWILKIGDGTAGQSLSNGESIVALSEGILIRDATNPIAAIVENTYHDVMNNAFDPEMFKNRAILAPTNEMVDTINDYVMSLMSTKEKVYLSSDSICKEDGQVDLDEHVFFVEYLNTIKCSGLSSHEIKLKEGCIIMLLRNIDPSNELCSGTS